MKLVVLKKKEFRSRNKTKKGFLALSDKQDPNLINQIKRKLIPQAEVFSRKMDMRSRTNSFSVIKVQKLRRSKQMTRFELIVYQNSNASCNISNVSVDKIFIKMNL